MTESTQRKRFAAALILFLAWIVALATLAIVSARRPGDRSMPPPPASHAEEPA